MLPEHYNLDLPKICTLELCAHLNMCMMVCVDVCVCCVLRRTVIDGVSEEHQAHGHCAGCQVVILQLGLHERLETLHVQQVLIHIRLTQEIT